MSDRPARVYLDHNATSPLRPEARRAWAAAADEPVANPSSLHTEGRAARAALEEARGKVAALLGVPPREVVFTSGGSEAITAAVRGVCDRAPAGRRRVVASAVEHSAVLEAVRQEARHGVSLTLVPADRDGRVDPEVFASTLGPDVALAALQWANNEIGVVQPVDEVAHSCRPAGIPFLVDAVQAAGKLPIDARRLEVDLLVVSGHKLGGPAGTGALVIREGIHLARLVAGGAQERRRRGGTEAVASLVAFGAAAEAAGAALGSENARLLRLRARIETRLRDLYGDVRIHGEGALRLANTVNFALPGVPGELLAIALDVAGFAVSTGSACASGAVEPSHVILALGCGEEEARGAVRVSLGWTTTAEEVDRFLDLLPRVVAQVRSGLTSTDATRA
jgi:cysteine desulfurase